MIFSEMYIVKNILRNIIFIFIFARMNSKWYISTLIVVLAFLGLSQEQAKLANQQIVLQFTDVELTSVSTRDDALAMVTEKLEAFGIVNIEIVENDDAQLSIRYYSDIDALGIREFLSQDSELLLLYGGIHEVPVDFPKDKLPETYRIVVSDLQQQTDDVLSSNGKFAFELNHDHERFSNTVVTLFNDLIVLEQDALAQVAFNINKRIAIAIDNTSDTIPEVRAGPYIFGNS